MGRPAATASATAAAAAAADAHRGHAAAVGRGRGLRLRREAPGTALFSSPSFGDRCLRPSSHKGPARLARSTAAAPLMPHHPQWHLDSGDQGGDCGQAVRPGKEGTASQAETRPLRCSSTCALEPQQGISPGLPLVWAPQVKEPQQFSINYPGVPLAWFCPLPVVILSTPIKSQRPEISVGTDNSPTHRWALITPLAPTPCNS